MTLPDVFVQQLSGEVLSSPAVNHTYLDNLRHGNFPDMPRVLHDFATQYGHYSACFTQYMHCVIEQTHDPDHRAMLEDNLAEEQGLSHHHGDEHLAIPHTQLFQRFALAVGATQAVEDAGPGHQWSRQFLALCRDNQWVGIGAIGLGTEFLVSHIYRQILAGLGTLPGLPSDARLFFELHTECDDEHARQILDITTALATDDTARRQIAHGARTAVTLRSQFWDAMLLRAQHDACTDAPAAQLATA